MFQFEGLGALFGGLSLEKLPCGDGTELYAALPCSVLYLSTCIVWLIDSNNF